jgi:hypothetical protein
VDAFEQLVSEILWMSGFWVRTSVKVKLTKVNAVCECFRMGPSSSGAYRP